MTVPTNETAVWAIDGEFKMSSERARELAWIATGGQTGVVGPESLEVRSQPTPDGTVRILPGGFVAQATPERIASGSGYTAAPWQSYLRSLYAATDVAITATDSSGPRSDFVGIEVVDPWFEGTSDTVDWGSHDFWRTRVIQNVSSDGVMVDGFVDAPRPFIPLARVDIPASTGTITDDMITDLRFLAVTRREQDTISQRPTDPYSIDPGTTQNLGVVQTSVVPLWATHVLIDGEITGARLSGSGDAEGNARLVMRRPGEANGETDPISFAESVIGDKFDMPVSGRLWIPRGMRGYNLEMWFHVEHNFGGAKINLARASSMYRLRLTFEENPLRS